MRPLYYELKPVYEQTTTMSENSGVVVCLASQAPLAASGGPAMALDPDVVEALRVGILLRAAPLLQGQTALNQCLDQIIRISDGVTSKEAMEIIHTLAKTARANIVDAC